MEHDSSKNKRLRKEITARVVVNEKVIIKKFNIEKNIEEIHDGDVEIKNISEIIRKINRKNKNYSALSLRLNELNKSKTEIRKNEDALKRTISHIEEANDLVKLEIIELKRRIRNLPSENMFDFTDYVEKQNEDNEIDLDLLLVLAE